MLIQFVNRCLQRFCADVLSVLGMTMSETRDCLKYRMLGSQEPVGSWGHEYVRYCECLFLCVCDNVLLYRCYIPAVFAVAVFYVTSERQTSSRNNVFGQF